jgi:hypothetical protein
MAVAPCTANKDKKPLKNATKKAHFQADTSKGIYVGRGCSHKLESKVIGVDQLRCHPADTSRSVGSGGITRRGCVGQGGQTKICQARVPFAVDENVCLDKWWSVSYRYDVNSSLTPRRSPWTMFREWRYCRPWAICKSWCKSKWNYYCI